MSTQGEARRGDRLLSRRPYERALSAPAWLRIALRLAALAAGTAILALAWFAGLPFCARSTPRRRALRGFAFKAWSRWCLACLRVELDVRGAPAPVPSILVANHMGYVDILVLASQQNCVFVSMQEVRRYPFIGRMASSFGTVFLEREKKRELPNAAKQMQDYLSRGYTVVLFPEGTNSRGDAVQPFRPALLEPAVQDGRAVAYATLSYATFPPDPPASLAVCWVDTPIVRHALRLLALRRIRAELTYGADLVAPMDRKSLAQELQRRVSRALVPVE